MMRVVTAILVLVIGSSLSSFCKAQETYQNRDPNLNTEIDEKDFKYKLGAIKSKSWGDLRIYDTPKTDWADKTIIEKVPDPGLLPLEIPPMPQASQRVSAPIVEEPRPVRQQSVGTTRTQPESRRNVEQANPPSRREPEIKEPVSQRQSTPQPVERSVGQTPDPENSRPDHKTMRWGQKGEEKSETQKDDTGTGKPKYDWGR